MPTDNAPPLSLRVVPPYKEEWDPIGRLYRLPDFDLPTDYQNPETYKSLLREGKLVPSVTNVVGVRNSPHLLPWVAKKVAQEAVTVSEKWPGHINRNPKRAYDYLRRTADRERDFWGSQGTRVHRACELLSLGLSIDDREDLQNLTEYEQQSIDSWKKFLDEFQPVFKNVEFTVFGSTAKCKGFAGTGDWEAEIAGVDIIGDLKCVTDDTPILIPDGSYIYAADVQQGQDVVVWSKDQGIHTSQVTTVEDNGFQDTVTIKTVAGQSVESTLNHPFLASRSNRNLGWVEAKDLRVGDSVYLALGWNHSPLRESKEWGFNKYLSPYLFGVLWSLINFNEEKPENGEGMLEVPKYSRNELRLELEESGFVFNKQGKLLLTAGLKKMSRKIKKPVEEIFELISQDTLPQFVFAAPLLAQEALVAGIQEVFSNKQLSNTEFYAVLTSEYALRDLQQLYTNYGQPSRRGKHPKTNQSFLRVPYSDANTIFIHGQGETKIEEIIPSEVPQPTVAIEVAGAHTHVTGGIISHNTNRTGLHTDIAPQLSALRHAQNRVSADGKSLVPAKPVNMTVGVHLSPRGATMKEIESGEEVFQLFSDLRNSWDFHVFDGKQTDEKGVFIRTIKSLKDM